MSIYESLINIGQTAEIAHQLEVPPSAEEIHLSEQNITLLIRSNE